MSRHLTQEEMLAYCQQTASVSALRRINQHFRECDVCADAGVRILRALRDAKAEQFRKTVDLPSPDYAI